MKKVIIQQECGLGDILFCQGIAHHFKEKGYEIDNEKFFLSIWLGYPSCLYTARGTA